MPTLLTTTQTDAYGNYSFSVLQFQLSNLGLTSGNIVISLDPSQYNTVTNELIVGTNVYHLSPSNVMDAADAGNSDVRDNDATKLTVTGAPFNGLPGVIFNISNVADVKNNYSFDFGFNFIRVLPIKLESFTATANNSTVTLNWQITQEINVKSYSIEFSTDGINFTNIQTIAATDNRAYSVMHNSPIMGINYYRLKTIDMDNNTVPRR
jgi:hypothetical protein